VNPYAGMMGQPPAGNQFQQLTEFLQGDFSVESSRLEAGRVPESADLLMVIDPEGLDEKQVFAIDQFLMQGGTVVVATSPFNASLQQQSLVAMPRQTGLESWLEHHGVTLSESFVMDPRNAAFPAPVNRQVGGFSFQEIVMLDYPYFADVRDDGINDEVGFLSGVRQLTLTWPSPVEASVPESGERSLTTLLSSSPGSWLSEDLDVMPRITEAGLSGFQPQGEQSSRPLAVMLEGRFESAFAGQPSPLLAVPDSEGEIEETDAEEDDGDNGLGLVSGVIDFSPENARLIIIGSNNFLADQMLQFIGSAEGIIYSNTTQLMANIVDWALEDSGLLSIRARGHFNRTLPPLDESAQMVVESINYLLALLGVLAVFGVHRQRLARLRARYTGWMAGGAA
jgi:ABC-2 type transport system permease protein